MGKETQNLEMDHSKDRQVLEKYDNHKAIDDTFVDQMDIQYSEGRILPLHDAIVNGESIPQLDTPYYRLSTEEKRSVDQLRSRLAGQIPPNYDTDFTLYRWLRSADRTSRQRGNIDLAEKLLANHLRFRKALKLDESKIPSWDENPMFAKRYLPRGYLHYMPSNNRFLWWVDYSSIDMAGIMNSVTSTDMLVWHFWKYEHMLQVVSECERRTGALSGVHMVMDVKDYDMNPFSLMLTTNGGMTYYAQLIHYEHYPELTCPVNVINVAKWLMLPYRLIRSVMPRDFSERIRVNDSNYQNALLQEISIEELPVQLGGKNPRSDELVTVKAAKMDPSKYYSQIRHDLDPPQDQISQIQVHARKRKLIPIECTAGAKLRWWFRADADVYFGIFFTRTQANEKELPMKKDALEKMEMVHPFFRLLTKLIPERGEIVCRESGTYVLVFCNKASWVYRRNVQVKIDIDESPYERKRVLERAYSSS